MFRTLEHPRWYNLLQQKLKIENKLMKISKTKERHVIIKNNLKILPTLIRLQVSKLSTNFKMHNQTKN